MAPTNVCAILSALVYNNSRGENNKLSLLRLSGWEALIPQVDFGPGASARDGFAATSFKQGNEIVIAFKGTDFLLGYNNAALIGDFVIDISLALELVPIQRTQTTAHERTNHVH